MVNIELRIDYCNDCNRTILIVIDYNCNIQMEFHNVNLNIYYCNTCNQYVLIVIDYEYNMILEFHLE